MNDETTTRATHGTLTAEQVREAIEEAKAELLESCEYVGDMGQRKGDVLKAFGKMEQAIADELNTELGSDDEYEAKIDALLCRLTNGKWSKSRAYDLDFMVSCVEEEFEAAELGSGTCEQVLADCDDGLMPPFTAHCSACGAEWGFTPKYCHNCGAKCTGTRDERKAVER